MRMSSRTVLCGEMVTKRDLRRHEQPGQLVAGFILIKARYAGRPYAGSRGHRAMHLSEVDIEVAADQEISAIGEIRYRCRIREKA